MTLGAPTGATHQRRPEYLTAWLYVKGATIPEWLVEKYRGNPLPDHRLGLYATAVDGEFWRWMAVAKFNELYVSVDTTPTHAKFLVDRLDEFDPGEQDAERDFHGHVAPAIARLKTALGGK